MERTRFQRSLKSDAWKTVGVVIDETGAEIFGVAGRFTCSTYIVYKKKEGSKVVDFGTTNLHGHMHHCRGSGGGGPSGLRAYFSPQHSGLGEDLKGQIKRAEAMFVSGMLSSFNIVENEFFKQLCQTMINIGEVKGKREASRVLYGRKTVQATTIALAEEVRKNIRSAIVKPAMLGAVSFVTDIWTDSVVQNSFLELSLFWVEESDNDGATWNLRRAMYHCQWFPTTKTTDNILEEIDSALNSACLDLRNVPVTTDKGANIVAATSQQIRVDCACHRPHTAIKTAWNEAKAAHEALAELDDACRRLVQYVKKLSGIQGQLDITMKQGGSTRPWRALVKMLESIMANINDEDGKLARLLRRKRKESFLSDIDSDLLKSMFDVLSPAKVVFAMWECSSQATTATVLPMYILATEEMDC